MSDPKHVMIEPQSLSSFHQGLLKTLVYFFILILVAWGVYSALPLVVDAIFLIIVASILTAILNPLVDRMESQGIRRGVGTLIVFGGLFLEGLHQTGSRRLLRLREVWQVGQHQMGHGDRRGIGGICL